MAKMKRLIMILSLAILPFMAFAQSGSSDKMRTKESNSKDNNSKNTNIMTTINKFEFPQLPYAYDALEPFIDKLTMEIHYSKHHKAYFDNFGNAIKGTELESKTIEDIFANISKYPAAVRNNGGGFYNHIIYWESMKLNGGKPS